MREREETNRTRVAGHLDEIQGVVANTLKLPRNGAVGFIDWLDVSVAMSVDVRGNRRSNRRELCDVCNLLIIQAHPAEANGSLNNVALNLTRREWHL